MSVKVRPYRRGGWEVDIRGEYPDGTVYRIRVRSPVPSRTGSARWGEAREKSLTQAGRPQTRKEVPSLQEFAPRFIENHARANRQKPSGIASKESILRIHLLPALGTKALDSITNEEVQRLKTSLADRAPKTVNNVLTVLNMLLRVAVDWKVIESLPCRAGSSARARGVRPPRPGVPWP